MRFSNFSLDGQRVFDSLKNSLDSFHASIMSHIAVSVLKSGRDWDKTASSLEFPGQEDFTIS